MGARERYRETSATADEQRPCARGSWCSASTRDTEGEWRPARSYQAFCAADQSLITASAAAIPAAYRRLEQFMADPVRRSSPVRVPPGSRVLVDSDSDALIRVTAPVVGAWAARVRAVPGLTLSRHGHPPGSADAVTADCTVLARHTGPLLALPDGPMARTWTWRPGEPMPPELEDEIGDLEWIHRGDGWIRAMHPGLSGETAGHDLLDLHRAAVRLLGETPAPLRYLDGIPCRACETMSALALQEQSPPDPEQPPPPYTRCADCRDEMTRAEYKTWTDQYAAWTSGSGILTCRRCSLGRCGECQWAGCSCRHAGHARAA